MREASAETKSASVAYSATASRIGTKEWKFQQTPAAWKGPVGGSSSSGWYPGQCSEGLSPKPENASCEAHAQGEMRNPGSPSFSSSDVA